MEPLPPTLALVPAAGFARRLGVEGSKAALALGIRRDGSGRPRPVPLADCLLRSLAAGGVSDVLVLRRPGSWDLAGAIGDGHELGLSVRYRVIGPTAGVAHTLACAAGEAAGRTVALGFPDVVFAPLDAFARMLARLARGDAEVVLGLLPADRPWRTDMIELDASGRPRDLVPTPETTTLTWAWLLAVWRPAMTEFLTAFLHSADAAAIATAGELRIGHVLRAALHAGLGFDAEPMAEGWFHDVATPEDLTLARERLGRS